MRQKLLNLRVADAGIGRAPGVSSMNGLCYPFPNAGAVQPHCKRAAVCNLRTVKRHGVPEDAFRILWQHSRPVESHLVGRSKVAGAIRERRAFDASIKPDLVRRLSVAAECEGTRGRPN